MDVRAPLSGKKEEDPNMTWPKDRQLLRESKWSREYSTGPSGIVYESKFVTDGLKILPSSIKQEWDALSPEARRDFALAFCAGTESELSQDDQEILAFLMQDGTDEIWSTIATTLARHPDRDLALRFLLEQIQFSQYNLANYFRAVELLAHPEAVPILRRKYELIRRRFETNRFESRSVGEWIEYLQCCRALWKLTNDKHFEDELRQAQSNQTEKIRSFATLLLRS
jgi:hypothetical protein